MSAVSLFVRMVPRSTTVNIGASKMAIHRQIYVLSAVRAELSIKYDSLSIMSPLSSMKSMFTFALWILGGIICNDTEMFGEAGGGSAIFGRLGS